MYGSTQTRKAARSLPKLSIRRIGSMVPRLFCYAFLADVNTQRKIRWFLWLDRGVRMVDVPLDSSRTFGPQVCCLLQPAMGASRYESSLSHILTYQTRHIASYGYSVLIYRCCMVREERLPSPPTDH